MRSLRARFILSHILPLLVIVPLVGAALVYLIETQVLLETLSGDLTRQAVLVAEITSENAFVWYDPDAARAFLEQVGPQLTAGLTLIDPAGRILASNQPALGNEAGPTVDKKDWEKVLAGDITTRSFYSPALQNRVAQVLVPVINTNGTVIGVVGLTSTMTAEESQFVRLRILVIGVLGIGLAAGVLLGWRLAAQLAKPLRQTTEAVQALAEGRSAGPLPETGPDELLKLTRAFNIFNHRTRTLEENRKRLLANLAHELGRPLGSLLSGIQAMQGGAERNPKLRRELLEGMEGQIRIMRRLTDEITHLYGQALGPLELKRMEIRLSSWLPRILAPWRESARARKLAWEAEIPADLPAVSIDPDRIEQALGNLLSNSIKFTPRGTITVRVNRVGAAVQFEIADTGPGIAAEENSRIFLPFYRGKAGGRFPQGMGLGLSIARDIAEAHGGSLEVRPPSGAGAVFVLSLPILPPA
jgi:two-component system, OmpR family, sensor histidine kinase BaeS